VQMDGLKGGACQAIRSGEWISDSAPDALRSDEAGLKPTGEDTQRGAKHTRSPCWIRHAHSMLSCSPFSAALTSLDQ
jgi:hypothetical protein